MVKLGPPLRPARKDDAEALAGLVDLASEGLATHLWSLNAQPGEQPRAVGVARARREEGGFSYRNAIVCEADNRVAGMLVGYRQPDPFDDDADDEVPDVVRPLLALERLAPGSWYVNVLAVFPEFQRRGLGTRLLACADDLARESGAPSLSIIVASANAGARALYKRTGFRRLASRPVVAFPGLVHGGDWVLLVRPVAPAG